MANSRMLRKLATRHAQAVSTCRSIPVLWTISVEARRNGAPRRHPSGGTGHERRRRHDWRRHWWRCARHSGGTERASSTRARARGQIQGPRPRREHPALGRRRGSSARHPRRPDCGGRPPRPVLQHLLHGHADPASTVSGDHAERRSRPQHLPSGPAGGAPLRCRAGGGGSEAWRERTRHHRAGWPMDGHLRRRRSDALGDGARRHRRRRTLLEDT